MDRTKFFLSLTLTFIFLIAHAGAALAAPTAQDPTPIVGLVESITLETDPTTGVITVLVDLLNDDQMLQSVRISQETAIALRLVTLNGDGKPEINTDGLGKLIQVDQTSIIPAQEENPHPVGNALATFFAGIEGVDYETIMSVHGQGVGFGTIAQTLWLTRKLDGDVDVFTALITARQTGDYSSFVLADGSTPTNWGQLRKAILDDSQHNGVVMKEKDHPGADANDHNNKDKDKDKTKNNNGSENGNNKDKVKDNEKDKGKEKEKKK